VHNACRRQQAGAAEVELQAGCKTETRLSVQYSAYTYASRVCSASDVSCALHPVHNRLQVMCATVA
jgi:hypothetical protein